jgi:hypothetical protein
MEIMTFEKKFDFVLPKNVILKKTFGIFTKLKRYLRNKFDPSLPP